MTYVSTRWRDKTNYPESN